MKLTAVIIVLAACAVLLVLAIAGVWDKPLNKETDGPSPYSPGGGGRGRMGRTLFRVYDAKMENRLLYECWIMSATETETPEGITKRWELQGPEILPKDENGRDEASITSESALLDQVDRMIRKESHTDFLVDLRRNVSVDGRTRTNLRLTTDALLFDNERKEVKSDEVVRLSDRNLRQMLLNGRGMAGMVNFNTLVFNKNVTAYFAGNDFSTTPHPETELQAAGEQRMTRVTCDGPMTMRRFDDFVKIDEFLATFKALSETFAALPPAERDEAASKCLRFFQKRFADQYISSSDAELASKTIRQHFGEAAPQQAAQVSDKQVELLLAALKQLKDLSADISIEEIAALQKVSSMINSGELKMQRSGGAASLILITFNTNVVAVTRPLKPTLLSDVEAQDSAQNLFAEPHIDSWQKCDRLVVFLKQWSETGPGGEKTPHDPEPAKVEMLGLKEPILMKSFTPSAGAPERLELDSVRECRTAHLYLEPDTTKKDSPPTQSKILLDGDVLLQKLRQPTAGESAAGAQRLYEARGNQLIWQRDTGLAELLGTADEPPQISYTSMQTARTPGGESGHSAVVARCGYDSPRDYASSRIALKDIDANRSRVYLYRNVRLEMSQAGAAPGEPLETLHAIDWVELTFNKQPQAQEESETVFGGVESLEAAGNVQTGGQKGQTWSDMLEYTTGKFEERPARILVLRRLNAQNREALLKGRPFTGKPNWPLEAVMQSASSPGFLGEESEAKERVASTYTADCAEKITYVEFTDDVASPRTASVVTFDKDVTLEKQSADSRDKSTLKADDHITLRFISKDTGQEKRGRRLLDLVSLSAVGSAKVVEPTTGPDDSKIQMAEGDVITWQRTPASAGAPAQPDVTTIEGKGSSAPTLRYTDDRPKSTKNGAPKTQRLEETTTLKCSPKGGLITVTQRTADGKPEKLVAKNEAEMEQTRKVYGNGSEGSPQKVLHLEAGELRVFMIPDETQKSGIALKKIEAYDNVLVSGAAFTAHSHKAEWERFYEADIVEKTTLYPTPRGTPEVKILRLDSNGRPSLTQMTCSDKLVMEKVIYDENISPNYSSKTTVWLYENAHVDHEGFADRKDKALHQETHVTCDKMTVKFQRNPRTAASAPAGPGGELYRIEKMIAEGNAQYKVFGMLAEGPPVQDKLVLVREGEGGYIEYGTPGMSKVVGRMHGIKDASGKYIKPARRVEYYDNAMQKLAQKMEDEANELPPILEKPAGG